MEVFSTATLVLNTAPQAPTIAIYPVRRSYRNVLDLAALSRTTW